MAQFEIAHKKTQLNEGGYSNDANDRGGETYKGIARNFHADWPGWEIIDEYKTSHSHILRRGDYIASDELDKLVDNFYKLKFWDINRLSEIKDQDIANEIYDTGVNCGTKVAARFLQKALNLLNRAQKDYSNIKEDGMIGAITIALTNDHKYKAALLKTLNGLQFSKYVKICEEDETQENNFRGWLTRV